MVRTAAKLPEVKEGQVTNITISPFAQAPGTQAFPRFPGQSSLPTLSPQPSMYGSLPRPHYSSMPHGQQVSVLAGLIT